ncbi:MAG: DUF4147 domain-containing protein [Chloroflexi bacterium]|nr:DUF4147 domain-containing protein [Chloroflexota bacterium]
MLIRNRPGLSTTALRRNALDLIEAGIERVLPANIMKSAVKYDAARRIVTLGDYTYPLGRGRIFVTGGGKAAALMAQALENILTPGNIAAGVVVCNASCQATKKIKVVEAGHPVPDQRGIYAVDEMLALKDRYDIQGNDLIVCLISGGGSALMPCPVDGVTLEDKQVTTQLLLRSGASIHEINAVRKRLSKTKGGRLGWHFSPATVLSLILSDVIGNDLDVIASGPTCPDLSTFLDAHGILEKYGLLSKAPKGVLDILTRGCSGVAEETPKTLANCINYIIGDNRLALDAMAHKAKALGLTPCIVTAEQKGDATTVARQRAAEILSGKYADCNVILIGGETTVTLPDNAGKGGRNQHYAATSMLAMSAYSGKWALASVGTDGSDFLPDVAGAMVDDTSLTRASSEGIDVEYYFKRYDSYRLFNQLGDSLIITGSTGTNVGDIMVYAFGETPP